MIAALFGLFALAAAQSADLPVEQQLDVRELDAGVWMHTSYRCLLYTSPSPRDRQKSRMPSSA